MRVEYMNENVESYLKSFDKIKIYDLSKELDSKVVAGLKRTRDVLYDNYMKSRKSSVEPDSFVVFDLETTGLSATNNEIIEIGAIRFIDNEPREQFHTYVKPKRNILQKITDITGITNEMVKDAPAVEDVLPYFIDFIKDDVLVAHNSSFDMSFILHNLFINNYKKLNNKTIDTLQLSRQRVRVVDSNNVPERLKNYKLVTLKEHFGLDELDSHNALDDCKVCAYVYLKIKDDCAVVEEVEKIERIERVPDPQPQLNKLDIRKQKIDKQKELLEQKRLERKEASEKMRQTREQFKKGIPTEADRKKSTQSLKRELVLTKISKIISILICILAIPLMLINIIIGIIAIAFGIIGVRVSKHNATKIKTILKERKED